MHVGILGGDQMDQACNEILLFIKVLISLKIRWLVVLVHDESAEQIEDLKLASTLRARYISTLLWH